MGQLLNVPPTGSAVQGRGRFDRRHKMLSECVVNGMFDARRHHQYKKRSYDEAFMQVTDHLLSKSI
jgi:hypothetical protein